MLDRSPTFPFLRLPPEIRNRIYCLLFNLPSSGHCHTLLPTARPGSKSRSMNHSISSGLGLLTACASVHSEAISILYGYAIFAFNDEGYDSSIHNYDAEIKYCGITSMYTFLQIIGKRNRELLRYMSIGVTNPRYSYYDYEAVPGFQYF